MLEIIYHMLSRREGYHEIDLKAMGARSAKHERERLIRKLTALGVNVIIEKRTDIPDAA